MSKLSLSAQPGRTMRPTHSRLSELIVPDPRIKPVPTGWWESVAMPVIESLADWDELDEAEGRLLAMASLIESMDADSIEFQKALRVVEAKRGELAGEAPGQGSRSDLNFGTHAEVPDDADPRTVSRWRTIRRGWDKIMDHLRTATERREVSQAACLRLVALSEFRTVPPPTGTYHTIVIDPPWPMAKIEREVRPNQGPLLDYPTMTIDEIAGLPVADLAAEPGTHVYLWTTHRFIPDALDLFERWGVAYQCVMTWVKNVGITPFSWMYDTEHVLFGRIGQLPLERMGLRLSFDAPATGHSTKPDVFYERVEQASPGPRLDMFARRARDGWDAWGNEVSA